MRQRKIYKTLPWQEQFMLNRSAEYTAPQLADLLKLTIEDVRNYLSRHKLQYKLIQNHKARKHCMRPVHDAKKDPPEPPRGRIVRPPAVYSNSTPFQIAKH